MSVFVVMASWGEYSDREEYPVVVLHATEPAAQEWCDRAAAQARELWAKAAQRDRLLSAEQARRRSSRALAGLCPHCSAIVLVPRQTCPVCEGSVSWGPPESAPNLPDLEVGTELDPRCAARVGYEATAYSLVAVPEVRL